MFDREILLLAAFRRLETERELASSSTRHVFFTFHTFIVQLIQRRDTLYYDNADHIGSLQCFKSSHYDIRSNRNRSFFSAFSQHRQTWKTFQLFFHFCPYSP